MHKTLPRVGPQWKHTAGCVLNGLWLTKYAQAESKLSQSGFALLITFIEAYQLEFLPFFLVDGGNGREVGRCCFLLGVIDVEGANLEGLGFDSDLLLDFLHLLYTVHHGFQISFCMLVYGAIIS
jgi:hypothetical protein